MLPVNCQRSVFSLKLFDAVVLLLLLWVVLVYVSLEYCTLVQKFVLVFEGCYDTLVFFVFFGRFANRSLTLDASIFFLVTCIYMFTCICHC